MRIPKYDESIRCYQDIERGTSFTIPIILIDDNEAPITSPYFKIYFTLKKNSSDFDYEDEKALIMRDAILANRETGVYEIRLSSKDTWLPPGEYYFDIMLKDDTEIYRLFYAKTKITEGISNRGRNDVYCGDYLGDKIIISPQKTEIIKISLPGAFALRYKDLPIVSKPSYLLKENQEEEVKEITHYTSRMRFPVILEQIMATIQEGYSINELCPFHSFDVNDNPFGTLKIILLDNKISIQSIPLQSKITLFRNKKNSINVRQFVDIPDKEHFTINIVYMNHLLIISGTHYGTDWPLMIEWFDFNN